MLDLGAGHQNGRHGSPEVRLVLGRRLPQTSQGRHKACPYGQADGGREHTAGEAAQVGELSSWQS